MNADDEVYDGTAELAVANERHVVRVRLTGYLDPIDGKYHWRGMVYDPPASLTVSQPVTLAIDDRSAAARITEQTPWGSYSIAGVGAPPFALDQPT
jgi:hypothetical protein